MEKIWLQNYDPLNNVILSTAIAAVPIIVLLGSIAIFRIRIHFAALSALVIAIIVAVFIFRMPVRTVTATTIFGTAYGLFPIG